MKVCLEYLRTNHTTGVTEQVFSIQDTALVSPEAICYTNKPKVIRIDKDTTITEYISLAFSGKPPENLGPLWNWVPGMPRD